MANGDSILKQRLTQKNILQTGESILTPEQPVTAPAVDEFSSENINDVLKDDVVLEEDEEKAGVWTAAFQTENIVGSAFTAEEHAAIPYDEDYQLDFDEIEGYEDYIDEFRISGSEKHTEVIKKKIDKELKNRGILQEAGIEGVVASVTAGILDPVNLIPIAGWAAKGKGAWAATKSMTKMGGSIAAIEAGREGVLHSMQATRTLEESVYNTMGAAVLGSALGGTVKLFGKQQVDDLADNFSKHLAERTPEQAAQDFRDSMGAARVVEDWEIDDLTMVNEKVVGKLAIGPTPRLLKSRSKEARKLVNELASHSYLLKGHTRGKTFSPSVSSRASANDTKLLYMLDDLRGSYQEYLKRVPKAERAFRNEAEFQNAVMVAMHRGDISDVTEVTSAATKLRKYFDEVDNGLVQVGKKAELGVKGALTYFPRAYNHSLIKQNPATFIKELSEQVRRARPDLDENDIYEAAENIKNNIVGANDNPNIRSIMSEANPLKARKIEFELDGDFLSRWMDPDVENTLIRYHQQMTPRLEIGKWEIENAATYAERRDAIRDEYNQQMVNMTDKQRRKAEKQLERDLKDLDHIYSELTHTVDPGALGRGAVGETIRTMKQWSAMRHLGGVTLTSIPDAVRPMLIDGLVPYAKEIVRMIDRSGVAKLSKREKLDLVGALEKEMDRRTRGIAGFHDDVAPTTKAGQMMDAATGAFFKATLLRQWNATGKRIAADILEGKMIRVAQKQRMSQRELESFAQMGIDQDTLQRIFQQMNKHGDVKNKLANVEMWDDIRAQNAYVAALQKTADEIILTPRPGSLPRVFSRAEAGLLLQFKSFMVLMHNDLATRLARPNQAQLTTAVVGMVVLAGMANRIKDFAYGREPKDNAGDIIYDAVDYSGVVSFVTEGFNVAGKINNNLLINKLWGGGPSMKYLNRTPLESMVGPGIGGVADGLSTLGEAAATAFTGEEYDPSLGHKFRRMMPGQNLFYLRRGLNELEQMAGNKKLKGMEDLDEDLQQLFRTKLEKE